MNSIRRRRRRPRRRSVNFRTFHWVLQREAALTIIAPELDPEGDTVTVLRGRLAFMPTSAVRTLVRRRRPGAGAASC